MRDFEGFFSSVTRLFITDPGFFSQFKKSGRTAATWPDCSARSVAMKFESDAAHKSLASAKALHRTIILALPEVATPHTIDELWAVYDELRLYGVMYQAGQEILRNPLRGVEVISNIRTEKRSHAVSVQAVLSKHIEKRLSSLNNKDRIKVIVPEWEKLSEGIGGFNPGRVFLFVAGTGVGKTTLTLNLAASAIKQKDFPVLFINMEMTIDDVLDRVTSIVAGVPLYWMEQLNESYSEKVVRSVSDVYDRSQFLITDGRALSIDEISSQIFHHKENDDVKLVIIDYDQKIRSTMNGDEWRVIQKSVEAIEEIAKMAGVSVIILAQGDENGDPKASKRSTQPASAVLSMYDEHGTFYIETKKNRFGKKFKLRMNTDFSKYQITEDDYELPDRAPTFEEIGNRLKKPKNYR